MSQGLVRAKAVMVGAPGVGKTSLVRRFVHSVFSEDYHSTLGVKVDRKSLTIDGRKLSLILWDIHGESEGLDVPAAYLRGVSGALVVFDVSRVETMEKAAELQQRVIAESPNASLQAVANKADLSVDWQHVGSEATKRGLEKPLRTSAKTGEGVDAAFEAIGRDLIARQA